MTNGSDVERIWTACNACGADAFDEILKIGDWTAGRCGVCSLIYVNPIPYFKKTNYSDIAKISYYTKHQREITLDKVAYKKRQLQSQYDEISKLALNLGSRTSFLDIGCGPGIGVRAANELGWQALGLDIDSELVELGKKHFGVDLRCSDLFESHFSDGQFNFVQFLSVLHLLPNPLNVLVEVKRVLSPGGVVSIVVPNQDGLLNRLNMIAGRKRQKRYGTLVFPYHLHAFTPETLERLIVRSGLTLQLIKTATPIDPRYAAIDQVANGAGGQRSAKLMWRFAEALRRGSLLVAYAGK